MRWRAALVVGLLGIVALPGVAHAAPDGKPAPLYVSAGETINSEYIVVYRKGVTASGKLSAERRSGGQVRRRFTAAVQGFSATLSAPALAALRSDPSVAYVQTNARMKVTAAVSSWGLDRVNQRALPLDDSYTAFNNGQGVHVYVLDTGVRQTHADFGGRIGDGYDFIDNDTDPSECFGHGTHVAGTVGGTTFGVAKGVTIHSVRVVDCGGFGTPETFVAGADWIAQNRQKLSVVNVSLQYGNAPVVDEAVRNSTQAGITYVVAAANFNIDACSISPARTPEAITVGATDSTDARAVRTFWGSDFGPCLDLFAPGVDIISASPWDDSGGVAMEGTSMATPHVTGAAALYLQRHPNASPQQVRDAIVGNTTRDVVTDPGSGSPNLLLNTLYPGRTPVEHDYNADGVSDISVFRPSNGTWHHQNGLSSVRWGQAGDIPVPGDYNGDGRTDRAVFRPSEGNWYVFGQSTVQWGTAGDIPVPGDYNGDGTTDIAVFRPSEGIWYVLGQFWQGWGAEGDIPVPGDYNGDGTTDIAVFRPSEGIWYVLGQFWQGWGTAGDIPVPADYNGDGVTDIAVFRPSESIWYVLGQWWAGFGESGDVPMPGDYNGDGITDIAVFRPSDGTWYNWDGFFWGLTWGQNGDVPV